ncbi:hypothetical protein CRG98_031239 [Punica granatum]|uniref:Uncharacterized protein n=1 Tax=Punica granatum TaxID=22663 RepID=A0A2I0IY82_PUNGR|nr:hypothetical protein CRG98_031239 [Punica granatum]
MSHDLSSLDPASVYGNAGDAKEDDVDLVDVNVALQEDIRHGKRSSHPFETREEPHVDVTGEEGDWEAGDKCDESDGFQSIDSGDEGGSASGLP